ncbi:MAG: hypothetical protein Q8M88_16360 [Phenylobacterium sp.]|uniref:hypothetical protein n=1 Tax=Phenylobacterium sp. TaxID=1871053 RepID=UPI0027334D64|nr:hypothetical protein [Phenylobacterium sp.]MDP3176002.1 hypothetical protein [Phenylobacterium sp.]
MTLLRTYSSRLGAALLLCSAAAAIVPGRADAQAQDPISELLDAPQATAPQATGPEAPPPAAPLAVPTPQSSATPTTSAPAATPAEMDEDEAESLPPGDPIADLAATPAEAPVPAPPTGPVTLPPQSFPETAATPAAVSHPAPIITAPAQVEAQPPAAPVAVSPAVAPAQEATAAPPPPLQYARPPQVPASAPAVAPPPAPYRRAVTSPVHVDEVGRSPEAPPNQRDLTYEQRLRASFASAQGMQGPLDGAWTLAAQPGGDLYSMELVDRNGRPLEGAWRDLKRIGAIGGSGFLEDIQRNGSLLTLRFRPHTGAEAAVATLSPGVDGRWSGELLDAAGPRRVTLRRN